MGFLPLIAAVLALNASVAAAAEACPNEQLRQESNIDPATAQPNSALLPECRAYEMVSPLYKQSHDVGVHGAYFVPTELAVAPGGNAVFWQSQGNFGEPPNYFLKAGPDEPYLSQRKAGASGWSTSSAFAPQALVAEPSSYGPFVDFSPNLTSHSVSCGESDLTGLAEEPRQAYACAIKHEALPWQRTPLYTSPENEVFLGRAALAYRGASADLSRVFLQPSVPLLAGDVKAEELLGSNAGFATAAIYEISPVSPAGQLRFVNVGDEGGKPSLLTLRNSAGRASPGLGGVTPHEEEVGTAYHAVSESGETVFFTAAPEASEAETVYARIPCPSASYEFELPCEFVEREGQMVEGRQTVKVSDPNAKEGCAACAAPIVVADVTTKIGLKTVKVASGVFPAGVTKEMAVEGAGIPTGTSVSSVSGSTLVLSAEATASATGVTLTFSERKPAAFQGASADGSKVFFTTTQKLLNGDSTTNLYEYDFNKTPPAYMNGQRLVDLSPDPSGAQVLGVVRLASDGSHVYFIAGGVLTGEANEYGEHAEAGKENLYGCDTETGQIKFIAAVTGLGHAEGHKFPLPFSPRAQTTPDGLDLVFSSTAWLAGNVNSRTLSKAATASAAGVTLTFSTAVAKVTTTSGSTTIIASGGFPGVTKEMAVKGAGIPEGTRVASVSASTLILSAAATASETGVTLTFLTAVENVTTKSGSTTVSVPSGGFPGVTAGMAVEGAGISTGTTVSATGPDAVYRYDFATGKLTWLSHDAPGFTAPSEGMHAFVAAIPAFILGAFSDIADYNRAISGEANGAHDGEDIIFTTVERLAANDHSSGVQLYLWHCASPCPKPEEEGVVRMISDGRSSVEPNLHNEGSGQDATTAMSASGSDIFFSTGTPLVGQDTDELLDYYDARVGGGYPAPTPEAACAGEACEPPRTSSSLGSFGSAASSLLSAGGNLSPPRGASLAFQTSTPKPLSRAQKLAKALRACRKKHNKRSRVVCERQGRKKYASKAKAPKKAPRAKAKGR